MKTQNIFKLILCSFLFSFSLGMNAQKYYVPNEGELLMLSQPGDIKLSTVFPGEGIFASQIGYSPMKHISIVGSYISDKTSETGYGFFGPYDRDFDGFNATVSIGGYYMIKTEKEQKEHLFLSKNVTLQQGFLFDLYGGYGYGKINNYYDKSAESHFDTHKYYLQAGAHWIFRIGSLSYTFRAIHLDYKNGRANGSLEEQELADIFDGIRANNPFNLYESSFRYQIGIRQVRIYTGFTTKHRKENLRPNEDKRIIITAGLILELDEIFNLKKQKQREKDTETED